MVGHVPLKRNFSPVSESHQGTMSDEIDSYWANGSSKTTWDNLASKYRCVILAEAGAGKTEELKSQARSLEDQGKSSFFIRIEDIETDFYEAFEVGEEECFHRWLKSTDEAWFFLDSVDEARLESPNALRKALRRFAKGIKGSEHRAHIYLSSRPYAWHPTEDRGLLDDTLFLAVPQAPDASQSEVRSALKIFTMCPLDRERVQLFCEAYETPNIDGLLLEIDRANLWSLAERPFDLEAILAKWKDDCALGGRLELLRHNIDTRLRDEHSIARAQRQPLNLDHAKEGARRLAAAVILSGQAGLNIPDSVSNKPGLEAEVILADWPPQDVLALLDRGIFNDIIFGAVRFRHREVRELLAAEWFDGLLKTGNSRLAVEALFFREQYGETIIAPRLRPVLSWLILLDEGIRRRVLKLNPEIAIEGGDPSQLSLPERQRILRDIVQRIASNEDDRGGRDNSAIARIALPDLSADSLQLIQTHRNSDDAIFFLGRLAWQGSMASCIPPLIEIAVDSQRGIYARRASTRAIMACGSAEDIREMWEHINESEALFPRELLAETLDGAKADVRSVSSFLSSVDKLPPYERFQASGLTRSIHGFVDRLPVLGDAESVSLLIEGLVEFLEREPYVERGECCVSEEYAWLLGPAIHSVQKLVEERIPLALGCTALQVMLMMPALRYWRGDDFSEYKDGLNQLVPQWEELNDALYWASIEQAKTSNAAKSGESLTDDRSVAWLGHYWCFELHSLPRLLSYVRSRPLLEDRLIALGTAFGVYARSDRRKEILDSLESAVADNAELQRQLNVLLYPPVSEAMRRHEERHAEYELRQAEKEERERRDRDTWIAELRENPDRVRNTPKLKPGEWSNDQYLLLREIDDSTVRTSRAGATDWQSLVPEFGKAVALAYRDAAMAFWRQYTPTLQSEGDIRDSSVPYSLMFAMAGLEIEAMEQDRFPHHLSEPLVRHALRYVTWEINGFPGWLECVHKVFPALTEEAVAQELLWELANSDADEPLHYILHTLAYQGTWLHTSMAPIIMEWIECNNACLRANRHDCLRVVVNGGSELARLVALARLQITAGQDLENIAYWYALLVDCDPESHIPKLENWLSQLASEDATSAAQIFVTALIGSGRVSSNRPHVGNFRTPRHLKSLYILMHRYIRAEDDIDRAGGGVYSPELRDDAQDARNRLFGLLSESPGKECYVAIKALVDEHPEPDYCHWMAKRAYKRAEEDGDLELWSAEQVCEFNRAQTITPTTHRQLFDLAVNRLQDLKNWLERGNDSPWRTWQRAAGETEMRTLIAGWLRQQCLEQYTTAQEPELANSQRMDIWLENTSVSSPVPIELKLLDKNWSGNALCERLRNQLAGDYLREETAGCGVMLLVSQQRPPSREWVIDGERVCLGELANALKNYWQRITGDHPGVEAIEVIVIDLTQRARVSDS